jgi:S-adenosylhomocysteine hydrolase
MNNTNLFDVVDEYFWYRKLNLEQISIVASQHLLWSQLEMFKRFLQYWIKPEDIHIIWKNYSTNNDVFFALKNMWFDVDKSSNIFNYKKDFDSDFDGNIDRMIGNIENKPQIINKKFIFLDDGGHLIKRTHEAWWQKKYDIIGWIEQTSSWIGQIKDLELQYPFLNIARSHFKLLLETPHIGNHFVDRLISKIEEHNIKNPNCLVVWSWPIWRSIVIRIKQLGIEAIGYDNKIIDGVESGLYSNQFKQSSKNIFEFFWDTIKKYNVIIWATWSNIMKFENLENLWEHTLLVSVSSSDREFPSKEIRIASWQEKTIHEDRIYDNVILVNSWFPLTFKWNYDEVPSGIIQLTIASLYWAVLFHWAKWLNQDYNWMEFAHLIDRIKTQHLQNISIL